MVALLRWALRRPANFLHHSREQILQTKVCGLWNHDKPLHFLPRHLASLRIHPVLSSVSRGRDSVSRSAESGIRPSTPMSMVLENESAAKEQHKPNLHLLEESDGLQAGAPSGPGDSSPPLRSEAPVKSESSARKLLTLVIIHNNGKVLLGLKKRGFGKGYYNGFGGKVEKGETIEEAAARELQEEAGISAVDMSKRGILTFHFDDDPLPWEVHVFHASKIVGDPCETEEMSPIWFEVSELPFDQMWSDDIIWYPEFLQETVRTLTYTIMSIEQVVTSIKRSRTTDSLHPIQNNLPFISVHPSVQTPLLPFLKLNLKRWSIAGDTDFGSALVLVAHRIQMRQAIPVFTPPDYCVLYHVLR